MIRKLGFTLLFLALGSVSALAADFNGKWTGDVQGRMGTQTLTFDFHVDGSTLTGKITTPRGDVDITNGKVDGDNISFDQVLNFNGNSFTINYKGTADGADSIKFTRTFGSNGDRPPQDSSPSALPPMPHPQRRQLPQRLRSPPLRLRRQRGSSLSHRHRPRRNPSRRLPCVRDGCRDSPVPAHHPPFAGYASVTRMRAAKLMLAHSLCVNGRLPPLPGHGSRTITS